MPVRTPYELEQRRGRLTNLALGAGLLIGGLAITDQRALLENQLQPARPAPVAMMGLVTPVADGARAEGPPAPRSRFGPRVAQVRPTPRAFAANVARPAAEEAPAPREVASSDAQPLSETPIVLALNDGPGPRENPPSPLPDPFPDLPNPPAGGSQTDNPPPAVPEPATWIMMICSIGVVGALLRRERTRESRRAPETERHEDDARDAVRMTATRRF